MLVIRAICLLARLDNRGVAGDSRFTCSVGFAVLDFDLKRARLALKRHGGG